MSFSERGEWLLGLCGVTLHSREDQVGVGLFAQLKLGLGLLAGRSEIKVKGGCSQKFLL